MTGITHRPTSLFPEMFSWLENGWPLVDRNPVRIEDFVDDGKYVIRAELPGFDPAKDIELTVNAGHLVLSAHREQHKHGGGHSEFRYGSFSRSVTLPPGVRAEDVSARYTDGILEITVPVKDTEQGTPVTIDVTERN